MPCEGCGYKTLIDRTGCDSARQMMAKSESIVHSKVCLHVMSLINFSGCFAIGQCAEPVAGSGNAPYTYTLEADSHTQGECQDEKYWQGADAQI